MVGKMVRVETRIFDKQEPEGGSATLAIAPVKKVDAAPAPTLIPVHSITFLKVKNIISTYRKLLLKIFYCKISLKSCSF
jgi:hypothetical protein